LEREGDWGGGDLLQSGGIIILAFSVAPLPTILVWARPYKSMKKTTLSFWANPPGLYFSRDGPASQACGLAHYKIIMVDFGKRYGRSRRYTIVCSSKCSRDLAPKVANFMIYFVFYFELLDW